MRVFYVLAAHVFVRSIFLLLFAQGALRSDFGGSEYPNQPLGYAAVVSILPHCLLDVAGFLVF